MFLPLSAGFGPHSDRSAPRSTRRASLRRTTWHLPSMAIGAIGRARSPAPSPNLFRQISGYLSNIEAKSLDMG